MSESNIYTALAKSQLEFGTVQKGAVNPAFKSRYADLADVAAVVIPVLAANGVCVLHYMTGDNLRVMRTEFVHGVSGTRVRCDVELIVSKNDMQGMKSATTYAKRIGLESLSGIAPEDDDGNAAAKAAPRHEVKPAARAYDPSADIDQLHASVSLADLKSTWESLPTAAKNHPAVVAAKNARKASLDVAANADLGGDEIMFDGGAK